MANWAKPFVGYAYTNGLTAEPVPASYTMNGIPYDGKLGAPVLGKAAAELAHTASSSTAAKKINNVGGAFYYMQAIGPFDQPFDACTLFTQLIGGDYDEVGLIYLERPDNGYVLAYVQQNGIYYPMDLFSTCKGRISWIEKDGYSSGTDLNVLCYREFVGIPGRYVFGDGWTCPADTSDYIAYVCGSPEEFKDWYLNESYFSDEFNNPDIEGYLYHLFMYFLEGTALPRGVDGRSARTKFDNVVWDIYPAQYKDDFIFLYEREGYSARFRTLPDSKTWPEEIR